MPVSTTRRIVITGSECTGKTTLARRLAQHMGGVWVPEYARTYAETVARPLTADDVEPIARGQLELEEKTLQPEAPVAVLDTDLFNTVVYAEHYYGAVPAWIREAAMARRGDLYVLCDIDVPWVADGVRDRSHLRAQIHAAFEKVLGEAGAPVAVVRGLEEERFLALLKAVANLNQE